MKDPLDARTAPTRFSRDAIQRQVTNLGTQGTGTSNLVNNAGTQIARAGGDACIELLSPGWRETELSASSL